MLLLCSVGAAAPAADVPGRVAVQVDNDLPFYDRHYTSGLFFDARLPGAAKVPFKRVVLEQLTRATGPWAGPLHHLRPLLVVGQELYTPKYYWYRSTQLDDRPFAAWLFGRGGVELWGPRQHLEVWTAAGPVGPNALGRQTQDFSHNYLSVRSPASGGWSHQLRLGLGVQTHGRWAFDVFVLEQSGVRFLAVTAAGALDVGNLRIQAGPEARLQVGWFGPRRPTDDQLVRRALARFGVSDLTVLLHRMEVAFFLAGSARWVGHNAFLQGLPGVRSEHTVEAWPAHADVSGGWRVGAHNVRIETALHWLGPRARVPTDVGHHYWSVRVVVGR